MKLLFSIVVMSLAASTVFASDVKYSYMSVAQTDPSVQTTNSFVEAWDESTMPVEEAYRCQLVGFACNSDADCCSRVCDQNYRCYSDSDKGDSHDARGSLRD